MENPIKELPEIYSKDLELAIKILKNYGCSKIYIFGSVAKGNYHDNSDIDIAIEGINPKDFFNAYADLSFHLKSRIDLVNIDSHKSFAALLFDIKELVRVA